MSRVFALTVLTIGLTGCGSNDFRTDGIEEVRVSKSDGFSSFQERDVVTFDESESIRVFEDMLREADELPGVANVVGPEYDIEVRFEDGETDRYYLWLNDDPKSVSSLYDADDTNIGYRLPADVTEELIDLLESGD
ncbi:MULTISPECIES: hypothetical protein [unclassified Exiguobacterium]|uniref:hypothetical protein n=1 Tax=unclassified Exiguobacterium TaxID=2644629 RepID=UPI00103E472A|nr:MULTISPECIES: hypothetical protein [unclassified Exiguobacterium]TCI67947.1 hypothetical protein EVJ19_11720 [Exiguobacterium sp. IPCI3]TCI77365.1 hypothetical protein EVJ18_11715 [Exiguobacterium sp. IPCH1]TCI78843.1 hypothetical protein EVJ17_11715 [Exiguobacterium sp. IPBC4]